MQYGQIVTGTFLERPNRFIAYVMIEGKRETVHVKNTGRCKELLVPGVKVLLEVCDKKERRTKYDLVGVYRQPLGEDREPRRINMDSQAPNKVVKEWLEAGNLVGQAAKIYPERKYGESRIDFYVECGRRNIYIEVKGVTLEVDGVARFPDAPTERGVKHLRELMKSVEEGYEAYVLFVIQMKGVKKMMPNDATHGEFGQVLRQAVKAGVKVMAVDCIVGDDTLKIDEIVPVEL